MISTYSKVKPYEIACASSMKPVSQFFSFWDSSKFPAVAKMEVSHPLRTHPGYTIHISLGEKWVYSIAPAELFSWSKLLSVSKLEKVWRHTDITKPKKAEQRWTFLRFVFPEEQIFSDTIRSSVIGQLFFSASSSSGPAALDVSSTARMLSCRRW